MITYEQESSRFKNGVINLKFLVFTKGRDTRKACIKKLWTCKETHEIYNRREIKGSIICKEVTQNVYV